MGFIVSFTSHSARLDYVNPTIEALGHQTMLPNLVAVNLPRDCKNIFQLDNSTDRPFPVEINWVRDVGPATKLIPTWARYRGENIITIDDDVFYRPTLFEELFTAHLAFPGKRIATQARKLPPDRLSNLPYLFWPRVRVRKPTVVHRVLPLGAEGVLYPQNSLSDDVTRVAIMLELAPTCDDIWFWANGEKQTPGLVVLPFRGTSLRRPGSEDTALWMQNRKGANNHALRAVASHFALPSLGAENLVTFSSSIVRHALDDFLRQRWKRT